MGCSGWRISLGACTATSATPLAAICGSPTGTLSLELPDLSDQLWSWLAVVLHNEISQGALQRARLLQSFVIGQNWKPVLRHAAPIGGPGRIRWWGTKIRPGRLGEN